ncbi:CDC27 family protein, partial [Mariniblastus sp.]|nr:CDC27 family protein [Mariniblastus sp.]
TVINQQTDQNSPEQFWLLAEVAFLNQDYEIAAENYAEVENLNSSDVADSFRFHYAISLFQTKQYDEAMRNVKICELNHYEPRKVKQLYKQIQRERSKKLRAG